MFVDTSLVHDSLSLDEIKELFFTDEEVSRLLLYLFATAISNDKPFFLTTWSKEMRAQTLIPHFVTRALQAHV